MDFLRLLRRDADLWHETVIFRSATVRAHGGGDASGPNVTARCKPGTTIGLAVDRQGIPLTIKRDGANTSNHRQIVMSADGDSKDSYLQRTDAVGSGSGVPEKEVVLGGVAEYVFN